jgi:cytochrome c553
MKLNARVCTSLFVLAASFPLIAALKPQTAAAPAAATPAQAAAPAMQLEAAPENQNPSLPSWAYTPPTPSTSTGKRPPDDGTLLHIPGSTVTYTRTQMRGGHGVPDWFPDAHPPMPKIVSDGRKPEPAPCMHCHLPNGFGRPENQSIAGLPAGYILEQLDDFKNDRRHSSVPLMGVITMIPVAKAITPEEAKEAADYFASIKRTKWIRVVETNTVPKSHAKARMMVLDEAGGTEPIGNRIIEVPENLERAELRDASLGFVAYVPVGSLKAGENLVRTGGNGKTLPCTMCHGPNLQGMGNIPSIAGRSPSQMARQIFDFQTGARNGTNAMLMKLPVSKLTETDVVNITAYLASLEP